MKKKGITIVIIILVIAALAAAGVFAWFKFFGGTGSSKDAVYVEKVTAVMGATVNASNSYMGVVESQDTLDVNKASDREIEEIFVEVGEEVEVGTKLFSYTTIDLESEIVQHKFDIEECNLQIEEYKRQIESLEEEKKNESDDLKKKDIQSQIDAVNNSIAIQENNKKSINTQIEAAQKKISSSVITATMAGKIQAINKDGVDGNGNPAAFMKILASGDLRVKCKVNENNVGSIYEGMEVIVRSRVGDDCWNGIVSKLNTSETATDDNNNNYYYGGGGNMEGSSNYNFYVALDSTDGLMMGQHLYVEPSVAGPEIDFSKTTVIYDYYICYDDNGDPYVWAANSMMKLEKRKVTLGDYVDSLMGYEITDGLKMDDLVCYPMDYLYEGVRCVTSYEEVDQTSPMYQQQNDAAGEYTEDVIMEEGSDEMMDMMSEDAIVEESPAEGAR